MAEVLHHSSCDKLVFGGEEMPRWSAISSLQGSEQPLLEQCGVLRMANAATKVRQELDLPRSRRSKIEII
jgi:hypothetical protein